MPADRTLKVTDGRTLQAVLGAIFEEGVKSSLAQKALTEKEKQAKTASSVAGKPADDEQPSDDDVDALFGNSSDGGGAEDAETNMPDIGDTSDSEPADDTQEKLKSGEVSVKDIVEKLNAIRSGKSFKDSAVSKAIDDYVAKLKKPERVALMSFLQGIGQIVTGQVPGQSATSPEAQPADVDMKKGNEPRTIEKKPNVIKGPGETSKASPKPSMMTKPGQEPEENTTPPAPIVPKRRGASR